jgi:hypothetical protein
LYHSKIPPQPRRSRNYNDLGLGGILTRKYSFIAITKLLPQRGRYDKFNRAIVASAALVQKPLRAKRSLLRRGDFKRQALGIVTETGERENGG